MVKHFNTAKGVFKAVDGVDVDIPPSSICALLGPSGSGEQQQQQHWQAEEQQQQQQWLLTSYTSSSSSSRGSRGSSVVGSRIVLPDSQPRANTCSTCGGYY
jgi:ABC-type dipeptide/oligopeptide/nickel transport system ATPase component